MGQPAEKKLNDVSQLQSVLDIQLHKAVQDGVFPGGVVCVSQRGKTIYAAPHGVRSHKEPFSGPMSLDTVFDIAALSSVVSTTAIALKLCTLGKLSLTDRVSRYLPSFGVLGKSTITIRHLLTHTSCLPAWHPYFEELLQQQTRTSRTLVTSRSAREHIFNSINRLPVKGEVGSKRVYSDLGMLLMGNIIENVTGQMLDRVFYKYVSQPLGLARTSYIDLELMKRRGLEPVIDQIAPTEDCAWRKKILCGEVHDDNAWILGGVAGHSGIFSTAKDLLKFGNVIIAACKGQSELCDVAIAKSFFSGEICGFEQPSVENTMSQVGFSEYAFGLNAFTGCSLWIDLKRELVAVLCSNRIHPSESNKKIMAFRTDMYKEILTAVA